MYSHTATHNVVEAHCYALQCRRIDGEQLRSSINQQLIAGHFSHEGLRQLRTKLFCMQLTKAFVAKMSCNQLLIDTATQLLTINSPTQPHMRARTPAYTYHLVCTATRPHRLLSTSATICFHLWQAQGRYYHLDLLMAGMHPNMGKTAVCGSSFFLGSIDITAGSPQGCGVLWHGWGDVSLPFHTKSQ